MDGIFIRKKTNIWPVLLLLCGISLVALYVFFDTADPETTGEQIVFLIVGILCVLAAILSAGMNHGAYIHIAENSIQAKYHWFGRLDCGIDAVEFVLPQINTLTVLLKNGKRRTIMGVENSWALASAIRRQKFEIEAEAPDPIRQQLAQAQDARKKELWRVFGIGALLFANIFIAVLLTGGREMYQFSQPDWILFSVMGLLELLTFIGLFCVAQRCGKYLLPIEQLKYRLRGAVIAAHPLPTNNTKAVYTDENYSGRIVVCGFPNDESVYYCVQEIVGDFQLETVHTSEVLAGTDKLPDGGFSKLIDITSVF